jgi:hypothetical protein
LSPEAVCTIFPVETTGADLTGLLQDLNLVSKDSSLRILGGLGQIIDGSLQESLAGFSRFQNAFPGRQGDAEQGACA